MAFTELMVEGGSYNGFLDFYRLQAEALSAQPGMPEPGEAMVRLLAPPSVSAVQVLSGRSLTVVESDARPLLGAGWNRVAASNG